MENVPFPGHSDQKGESNVLRIKKPRSKSEA